MTHEVIAVLTLLLSLVSAVGILWIALRLERVAVGWIQCKRTCDRT